MFIFKYFFFIGACIMMLNALIGYRRMQRVLEQQPELGMEYGYFFKGYCLFSVLPFLLLGAMQLTGGYQSPFFVFSMDYRNLYVFISQLVVIFSWGLVLFWVFFKNGANTLVKFRVMFNLPNNEFWVKIVVVLMTLAGAAGLIFGISNNLSNITIKTGI